ncbi:MAG: exodeoxyribonuclease VII small subunit [Candidatus Methanomethylophilaceae archaeon]|nr:exodeoxyribonuclease VII small subunit [Candidatus Methanomethylophilaceae archaeon]
MKKLEAGNLDLDESLKIYEDAIVLRERCRKFLDESQRKVEKLMETANGVKREEFTV